VLPDNDGKGTPLAKGTVANAQISPANLILPQIGINLPAAEEVLSLIQNICIVFECTTTKFGFVVVMGAVVVVDVTVDVMEGRG